jgi:hypothetical protein
MRLSLLALVTMWLGILRLLAPESLEDHPFTSAGPA